MRLDVEYGSAEPRLLLGTVGWERPDWLSGYYPADLPPEWRLAYYANDCSCVLLPPAAWCGVACDDLRALLDEVSSPLALFCETPRSGLADSVCCELPESASANAALLIRNAAPATSRLPRWQCDGDDRWKAADTPELLVRWTIERFDLRELRDRSATLPEATRALVLDGPGADPGRIRELRTLLELLGRT